MEFMYVWPNDNSDKRRWLTGICRNSDLKQNNLHNHPLHVATKISSKIIQDIKQKMTEDPTTKTHDIVTGMAQFCGISHTNTNYLSLTTCMDRHIIIIIFHLGKGMAYMPAVTSLAAANKDKTKNIRATILRHQKEEKNPGVVIMNFESESLDYDKKQIDKSRSTSTCSCNMVLVCILIQIVKLCEHAHTYIISSQCHLGNHVLKYATLGHPYIRNYSVSPEYVWALSMSPMQSNIFSKGEFIEADVTYQASFEMPYLHNVVTLDYETLKCKLPTSCVISIL